MTNKTSVILLQSQFFTLLISLCLLTGCGGNKDSTSVDKDRAKVDMDSSTVGMEIASVNEPFAVFTLVNRDEPPNSDSTNKSNLETDFNEADTYQEFNKSVNAGNKNYLNQCDAALSVVYQTHKLKTNKEYLQTLHEIYESTSQEEVDQKRNSSYGISHIKYGDANWNTNKSKVRKLYNKYKNEVDFSLEYNEQVDLFETYTRSEDVDKALSRWIQCHALKDGIPYLQLQDQSDTEVIVFFEMKPNLYRDSNDKVKVTNITHSNNLTLIDGDLNGKRIKHEGRYSLKFRRTDLERASISVDLAEGYNVLPISIPAIKKDPIYESRTIKDVQQFKIETNLTDLYNSYLLIVDNLDNSQKIEIGDVSKLQFISKKNGFPIGLHLNVKTKLKATNANIYDVFYTQVTGNLYNFQYKGVKLEPDGSLLIDVFLGTRVPYKARLADGKLTVMYGITKDVCIANCP